MKSDLQIQTLADLSLDVSYGYTESAQTEPVGPRFLRITDIQNGVVDWPSVPYCTIDNRRLPNYLLQRGDIVVARTGNSTGENYIFDSSEQAVFASYLIRFRIDHSKANPFFVWYQLRTPRWWDFVSGSKTGSAQAGANAQVLGRFEIALPSRHDQDRIAEQLIRIDSKIAINRQINQTLEAMAQAIFKSWFVDFDPVKAKIAAQADGRDPLRAAMTAISGKAEAELDTLSPEVFEQLAATAALFTDEMEESELGEIPKGWLASQVGNIASRVAMGPFGSDIKKENFVDAGVPVIRGGNLTNGLVERNYVFVTESKADELKNANAFPGDIVITHRGTLGQVGLIPTHSKYHRYVVSQSQMLLSVKAEQMSARYLFEFLRSETGKHLLLSNTSQVGVPAIARPTGSVKGIPLLVPPRAVLNAYDHLLCPLLAELSQIPKSSETLAELRDTLLPKLLSGELPVAETMVEAVA